MPEPDTGTRAGGWETLLWSKILYASVLIFVDKKHLHKNRLDLLGVGDSPMGCTI
jgi:hypothetical protein